jgi:SNF2 family DNA or RNA helicase
MSPGLGKTAIVLSAYKILRKKRMVDKVLVIAPLRVCHLVWPFEVSKWSNFKGISVGVLHGSKKEKVLKEDHDIYCINPAGLKWLEKMIKQGFLKDNLKWKWLEKMIKQGFLKDNLKWWLVVDESSNFKNGRSQRFKILKKMLKLFWRRTILTGTPAPNGLINLWSQVYILDLGTRLGAYITAFRNEYFYPSGYLGYDYRLQDEADQRIYNQIDDIIMHKGSDELDLPPRIDNYISVELPPDASETYNDMKRHFIAEFKDDEVIAVNAAVKTGKLKQIANGGLYNENKESIIIHNEKTTAVQELIEGLEGKPLMLFYEYNHDLERIRKAFGDIPALGENNTKKTIKLVNDWNRGRIPIIALHPASAGHGLNLQDSDCSDICWYSIPFDLELYIQAIARVHRQGVRNTVMIHHIVAVNTIDSRILRILDGKMNVQDALLEELKQ